MKYCQPWCILPQFFFFHLKMFANILLISLLFSRILCFNFKEDSLTIPQDEDIPQKYTCPLHRPLPIDDSGFKECDKFRNIAEMSPHPDQHKSTPEILKTYGYPHKEYKIKTEDGYILTVYRITGSPKLKQKAAHKTPVYVNHGMIGASDWWFFVPPEKNLMFMMADEGYDVWISNARGTTYSLEHETLDYNKDLEYWDFTVHEMGIYDVPAVTNKILKESNHTNIIYLGFSMGTTEIFICLSEFPEMNKKFRAVFLWAPVAQVGHTPNIMRNLAPFADIEEMYYPVNAAFHGRIRNSQDLRRALGFTASDFCANSAAKCGLCDNVVFALNGVNPPQLNRSILPILLEKIPNSCSYKSLVHYGQLITSCRFQKFDYSPSNNLKIYGSRNAPLYNLTNFKSPLYAWYGEQDLFVIPMDVKETMKQLGDGVLQKLIKIPDPLFTHFDYCIAKDLDKLLHHSVLKHMRKYTKNY